MTPAYLAVVRKEVRQISRDRRLLPMLVVAPMVSKTMGKGVVGSGKGKAPEHSSLTGPLRGVAVCPDPVFSGAGMLGLSIGPSSALPGGSGG